MSKPAQKNTAKMIATREKGLKAIELRKAGASFEQIGKTLGMTRQNAHALVKREHELLKAVCQESVAELRQMELARLDEIQLKLWDKRGDPRAADTLLRLFERRSKLMGLDAPVKIDSDNSSVISSEITIQADKLTNDAMEQLMQAMGKKSG
jgi:hypothetical protein